MFIERPRPKPRPNNRGPPLAAPIPTITAADVDREARPIARPEHLGIRLRRAEAETPDRHQTRQRQRSRERLHGQYSLNVHRVMPIDHATRTVVPTSPTACF